MTKFIKTDFERATEIGRNEFHCVKFSDWTSGKGRFKSRRATPHFAAEFEKGRSGLPLHVAAFFAANPRVRGCLAIVNLGW